jgi:hypothetical protein
MHVRVGKIARAVAHAETYVNAILPTLWEIQIAAIAPPSTCQAQPST